jgi:hypothetical protein
MAFPTLIDMGYYVEKRGLLSWTDIAQALSAAKLINQPT